jgi:GH25 family lysozyme M1 (1,4-beta-N-acetylmuramidase)
MLKGIDISSYQSGLNAGTISVDFVIIKATEGAGYVNPYCDTHYQQAKKAGKLRGVYHFARNTANSSDAEAVFFVKNVKGYLKDAIIVLDWEDGTADVAWAKRWLDKVYQLTGVRPIIYMSESVVNSYDWSSVANANYGLWVAKYRDYATDLNYDMSLAGTAPSVKWWKFYTMWQWTSSGRLDGYDAPLDCNAFYGDAKAWQAYAGGTSMQDTPIAKPIVTTPTPAKPSAAVDAIYTVKPGDSLSAVFPANWKAVAAYNGLQNPNLIYPGQKLKIPKGATPGSKTPVAKTYTVKRGDILSRLFPSNWQTVAKLNKLANPNLIFPGQILRLP